MNIGLEFIFRTDHRVVCKARQNKPGFGQTSVKGIKPGMDCRVILARKPVGERRLHGGTDYEELYCWNQIYFY